MGIKGSTAKELLSLKKSEAEKDGHAYLKKLKDYLNANASSSKYAEYFASSSYQAPVDGDNAVFTNSVDNKYYGAL